MDEIVASAERSACTAERRKGEQKESSKRVRGTTFISLLLPPVMPTRGAEEIERQTK